MNKIWPRANRILNTWFFGLPLLYLGVVTLVAHYLVHTTDLWATPLCSHPCNWLLILAIVLEVVGATLHFRKIKHH